MAPHGSINRRARRWLAAGTALSVVLLLFAGTATAGSAAPAQHAEPVFGVNMSLYSGTDQLKDDPDTQRLFQSWGVPLVRVPMRSTLDDQTLIDAMHAVQAVGADPLLILNGPGDLTGDNSIDNGAIAARDLHVLGLVTQTFGDATVYLEYGNEVDYFHGVDADEYVDSWNVVVPQLAAAVPASYRFVGPTWSEADPDAIATVVAGADPRPDLVSWHEYVCSPANGDSREYCEQHVQNWATHVSEINAAERDAIGTTLPFFISEWNVDPGTADADEALYDDPSFIQPWTASAIDELRSLVPEGLAGAMIYTASDHENFALVDGDDLTPQGEEFQDLIGAGTACSGRVA